MGMLYEVRLISDSLSKWKTIFKKYFINYCTLFVTSTQHQVIVHAFR